MFEIYDVIPTPTSSSTEGGTNALQSGSTLAPTASSWPWIVTILALVFVIAILVALLIKEKEKHKE